MSQQHPVRVADTVQAQGRAGAARFGDEEGLGSPPRRVWDPLRAYQAPQGGAGSPEPGSAQRCPFWYFHPKIPPRLQHGLLLATGPFHEFIQPPPRGARCPRAARPMARRRSHGRWHAPERVPAAPKGDIWGCQPGVSQR